MRNLRLFIVFLSAIILSNNLWANGALPTSTYDSELLGYCEKRVNLARKSWVVRTGIPSLAQGPVATCYAHAAASYMDVWREWHLKNNTKIGSMKLSMAELIRRKPNRTSSWEGLKYNRRIGQTVPLWMGYIYKKYWASKKKTHLNLDEGSGSKPLASIFKGKRGSCREDVFEDTMKTYSRTGIPLIVNDFYAFTSWLYEDYGPKHAKIIEMELKEAHHPWRKAFKELVKMYPSRNSIRHFINNVDFKKVYKVIKPHLDKKNRDYLPFFEEVFASCFDPKNHYQEFNDPIIKSYRVCNNFHKKQKDYIKRVSKLLDRNIPVGLSYVGAMLKKNPSDIGPRLPGKYKTTHVSVLIGKRVRNGACQFLLQNSWGNACKRYSSSPWECQKDRRGIEMGVWIDAWDLASYGPYTFHVDKKANKCRP